MINARVAVVIPCYNDGELACEAARSVEEDEPVELVVVDDGSDRATVEDLDQLAQEGVQVVRHDRNRRPAAARMTGLRVTSAPYVFPLDADDMAVAGSLSLMADRLDAEREAAVCFGDYLEFGTHELVRAVPSRLDPYRVAYTNEYPVSALFRRSVLESVGGWRDTGYGYEDWGLWMTLAEKGALGVHVGREIPTYRRRLHGDRRLTTSRKNHLQCYRVLRRRHPSLFADIRAHRRRSDLSPIRKLLYPFIYGGRPRFAFEARIKAWLDRCGIWTLRR